MSTRFEAAYELAQELFPTKPTHSQNMVARINLQRAGFTAGVVHTETKYAPLIEAARAYREAHAAYLGGEDREVDLLNDLGWSERLLLKAARTFEGHVEEDANAD